MSSNFGGHEDDRGDCSLYSVDFDFEWSGEPTFGDVLDECSVDMSSYDQVTFVGEAGKHSSMMSSPGRLLPHDPASKFVKSDLVIFRRRYDLPNSAWMWLPLNGEKVDWRILSWVPMYEVPFKIGLCFPVPLLVTGVLLWYEITPSQLMPNS